MSTIVQFFQQGGAFMYPIALVLAIGPIAANLSKELLPENVPVVPCSGLSTDCSKRAATVCRPSRKPLN